MTGSEADTERTVPGDEEDVVDSGKLARFLTPVVPRPGSSIPPRPSGPPASSEVAEVAPEPTSLFSSERPVPRRNSSLLPPPGDAETEAPAPKAGIDHESPTSSHAVEKGSFTDAIDDSPEDEPDPDFVLSTGGLLADPRRRRIAIGAAAAAVILCLVLVARRRTTSPTSGAPNAMSSSTSALPPATAQLDDVPDPNDDPNAPLGAVDPDKARDLRREARKVLEAGHAEEGVRLARTAIQADPNDPEGYILLAAGLQDLGHWQESRDVFAKCVRESNGKASTECVYFATRSK